MCPFPSAEPLPMRASSPAVRPSRGATLRLHSVMGVVVYVAACLGVWRAYGSEVFVIHEREKPIASTAVRVAGGLILSPIAAVGGVGLWLESRRGQSPRAWGFGRWTWAFAGASLLIGSLETYLFWTVGNPHWTGAVGPPRPFSARASLGLIPFVIKYYGSEHFARAGGTIPLGTVLIAARWSGSLHDPSPDSREWSGRALAAAVFLTEGVILVLCGCGQ